MTGRGPGAGAWRPGTIDRAALQRLVSTCIDEHPEWSDEQVAGGLAVVYPGHDPGALAAVLLDAAAAARREPRP